MCIKNNVSTDCSTEKTEKSVGSGNGWLFTGRRVDVIDERIRMERKDRWVFSSLKSNLACCMVWIIGEYGCW